MAEEKTELRKKLARQRLKESKALRALVIAVLAAVAVYVIGCVYYSSHFYGSGTIYGIPVKNQTVEQMKTQITEKLGDYVLSLETRDGQEEISADQVDLAYSDQQEIDQSMEEQNPALWIFMALFSGENQEIAVTVDEDLLADVIKALSCMDEESMVAPTDAYLTFSEDAFVICPETYGNLLAYRTVYPAIRDAILSGETSFSLDESDCYVAPEIYQDTPELLAELDSVNAFIDLEITYDFSDRTIVADRETIAGWIVFADDFTYSVDEDAVADFVHDMAYETDTFGLSRSFTTHSGSVITLKGGDYGWCINQSSTTEALLELLEAGETVTVEPVYRYSGICRDTNDIGDSYVEVSISAQTMWVYKDGECIVSTPVVTGNASKGYDTPSGGVWAVDARITDYYLTGQDYSSLVSYWLPFNGNVGIHDATWRSEFGGDIYKTNGSHGCVNTPLSAMKTVYANVFIGYPVVVY